jgi:hypothetical protein
VTQLFDGVMDFFRADDWPVTVLEPESVLHTVYRGDHGEWNCFVLVRDEFKQLAFYSVCPIAVPVSHRPAVAEFLMRLNYNLHLGNFELNFDSGEVRYRTSLNIAECDFSLELMKPIIYTNVLMMDQHLPGIMSVSYGQVSPVEALEAVES